MLSDKADNIIMQLIPASIISNKSIIMQLILASIINTKVLVVTKWLSFN